jgi:hypothetical protein
VADLKVDPAYLDTLKASLDLAQQSFKTGFEAPRASVGGYPDKLFNTHGYTASQGCSAIMGVIDKDRAAVYTHLSACIKSLSEALDKAKVMYTRTDQQHGDIIDKQMEPGN